MRSSSWNDVKYGSLELNPLACFFPVVGVIRNTYWIPKLFIYLFIYLFFDYPPHQYFAKYPDTMQANVPVFYFWYNTHRQATQFMLMNRLVRNKFHRNIVKICCGTTRQQSSWLYSHFDNIVTQVSISRRTDT